MQRILLVSANTHQDPYPVYPLGLGVVAEGLRKTGRDVLLHDMGVVPSLQLLKDLLVAERPDCVGIGVRNVDDEDALSTHMDWTGDAVKKLVATIRKVSDAPVVLGGPGFSLVPDEFLAHTGADYGITGPGEQAFAGLLDSLASGENPPRLQSGHTDAETWDAAAGWEEPLLRHYLENGGVPGLHTKRGCPYRCVYCGYPLIEGRTIRIRPLEEVVDDMRQARDRFGVRTFFFTDAVFNDPQERYLDLVETLAREELGIHFGAYFSPASLPRGHLRLLIRAGLCAVEAGTDALSDTALDGLGKQHGVGDVFAFQALMDDNRIPCAHFLTFAGPGETERSLDEGLNNLEKLQGGCYFAFQGLRIHPRTPLHEIAIREGAIERDTPLLRPKFYQTPNLDPDWTFARINQAFQGRRDRFFPPEEGHLRMRILRRLGFGGLLWDTLPVFAARRGMEAPSYD